MDGVQTNPRVEDPSELTNAHFKTRFGLEHVLVRGTVKVTCVMLLASLAFNLLQHATTLLA